MADYWRGGWAEQGGMLPGTAAAMTAKNAGGSYGPLNALADILGAYWQKRDKDKVNKAVDEFEAGFDADMAPAPQWQAPSVMDGLMSAQGLQEAQAPQMVASGPPLSISEYSAQAKGKKAKLMRDLARKYGYGAVQDILPAVDEVINGKILGYANSSRDKIYDALREASLETLPGLLKQVDEYNGVVSPIGGSPIDIKGLLQNFAMKMANVDTGGSIVQQAAPASGLPFRNVPVADDQGNIVGYRPEYTRTAGILPKSLSPAQIEQAKIAAAKQRQAQYNADRNYALNVAKAQMAQGNKDREYEQKQKYYDWKMENGGGSKRKLSQAAEGALTGIAEMRQKALADISSGAALDEKNHSVREYMDAVQEAKEKGYISADEVTEANNSMMELQFYLAKKAGNEDYAAMMASQMTPDYWKEYMQAQWGDQPQ